MRRFVILSLLLPALCAPAIGGQTEGPVDPVAPAVTDAPGLRLREARVVPARFHGAERAIRALQSREAKPLAMATADFDEDGVPDIVCGYRLGKGGTLTLQRGNVDAIYPNAREAKERRAKGTFVDAPFLPQASAFETPGRPDFVGAGDFDADGHWDVVTAAREKALLRWHRGDGRGGFGPAETIELPGTPTALTIGEINRRDGLDDVVVAIDGPMGPEVLVFEAPEGALQRAPERLPLKARSTSLVLGGMDDNPGFDLLAAAGDSIVFVQGRDRRLSVAVPGQVMAEPPRMTQVALPFQTQSISVGRFDARDAADVAVLSASGSLHVVPLSVIFSPAQESKEVASRLGEPVLTGVGGSILASARISGQHGDDLFILDAMRDGIWALSPGAPLREPVRLDGLAAHPAALLSMRLSPDFRDSLVLLSGETAELSYVPADLPPPILVTTTDDSGPGSLRQALFESNDLATIDVIEFAIPGPGPHVIRPVTDLPGIRGLLILDATTQPGYSETPVVAIDGSLREVPGARGLVSEVGGLTLRGFSIINWSQAGLTLKDEGFGDTIVEGNFIGLDPAGAEASNWRGIEYADRPVFDPPYLDVYRIGGTSAAARNVISGNLDYAIERFDKPLISREGNLLVQGNHIGTNPAGTAAVGSTRFGIVVHTRGAVIGGTAAGAGNVMAGFEQSAVVLHIHAVSASYPGEMLLQGNRIGTDHTGLVPIRTGLAMRIINAYGNTIGGTTPSARNILSANDEMFSTVYLDDLITGTLIQGNYIGLGADGSTRLMGNGGVGLGGTTNTLGGTVPGARNVISGNTSGGVGIGINSGPNTIAGNYIGTDASGMLPRPNGLGVVILDGTLANAVGVPSGGNLISGNLGAGVTLGRGGANAVAHNKIGVAQDGYTPLPNGGAGVEIEWASSGNIVGGLEPASQNIIAHNAKAGIRVLAEAYDGNTFLVNSIYDNGGLGIDIGPEDITPNDPLDDDTGPNELQNYPEITLAQTNGETTRVEGTLGSLPSSSFTIRVYTSPACDPSGHGEGKYFLGSFTVMTDATGAATFSQTFPVATNWGEAITATANHLGDTSEFSPCKPVVGTAPDVVDHVRFDSASPENLVWDAEPGASLYHLYIGTLPTMPGLVSPTSDSCQAAALPQTGGTLPPGSNPPPGHMIWFLVTAENQFGEGTLQPATSGPRQLNSTGYCGESCAHDICGVGGPLEPACTLCASIVCAKDPNCCDPQNGAWDFQCVQQVRTVCRSLACAESQGQCPHSLCDPGSGPLSPGCDSPPLAVSCTAAVCQADPHCCQQAWDEACIAKMEEVCGYSCI